MDCLRHTGRIDHLAVHAEIHHVVVARKNSPSVGDRNFEVVRHIVELEEGNPAGRTLDVDLEVDNPERSLGDTGCMDLTWYGRMSRWWSRNG